MVPSTQPVYRRVRGVRQSSNNHHGYDDLLACLYCDNYDVWGFVGLLPEHRSFCPYPCPSPGLPVPPSGFRASEGHRRAASSRSRPGCRHSRATARRQPRGWSQRPGRRGQLRKHCTALARLPGKGLEKYLESAAATSILVQDFTAVKRRHCNANSFL